MRLWEFGVQDCRLDYLTISLTITSLPLNASLHDATPNRAWFSATKFTIYQINERRPRPGRFSTKLIFFIFQLMFVSIIFKKLTWVSAALPTQGKTAEKSPKKSSVIGDFYSVSCQIVVYRTQLRPRWHGPVSATGRWAGIFKFRIC